MVSLGQVIALIKAMGGSGGGSSLPSVSSTDNGDVLTVVNGAWDKAAPSGLPAVTSADNGKGLSVQNGAWAVDAYAGFDVVIGCDAPMNIMDDNNITLLKGSYADCMSKTQEGRPVYACLVYKSTDGEDGIYGSTKLAENVYCDAGYHDAVEISFIMSDTMNVPWMVVRNFDDTGSVTIEGAAGAHKTFYLTESGISLIAPWE